MEDENPVPVYVKPKLRDRVVAAVANWLVRTFASKPYQTFTQTVYVLGLNAYDREVAAMAAQEKETTE